MRHVLEWCCKAVHPRAQQNVHGVEWLRWPAEWKKPQGRWSTSAGRARSREHVLPHWRGDLHVPDDERKHYIPCRKSCCPREHEEPTWPSSVQTPTTAAMHTIVFSVPFSFSGAKICIKNEIRQEIPRDLMIIRCSFMSTEPLKVKNKAPIPFPGNRDLVSLPPLGRTNTELSLGGGSPASC